MELPQQDRPLLVDGEENQGRREGKLKNMVANTSEVDPPPSGERKPRK
jgi:hypothetical protein